MRRIGNKVCPFCAEKIKAAAKVCRFCGRDLPPQGYPVPAATLPAVPRIVSAEVLGLLTALVDKNLVIYDEDAQDEARYRLSETIRQYARDRLAESGQDVPVRTRHKDFFADFVGTAEPHLSGSTEQSQWFRRLDSELDNIRSALEWCCTLPEAAQDGLRVGAALFLFW